MRHPLIIICASLAIASCSGTAPRQAALAVPQIPLLTFVFDDGNDTDAVVGRKLFAEHGAVACSAVTTEWIGRPGHLTAAQIISLQDAGWEIMSHTVSHPNLRSLSAAGIEEELARSKAALEELGATVTSIVYPYNKSSELVRGIARKYYRSGRGGTNSYNTAIPDPYYLKSFSNKHDIGRMKGFIDRAHAARSWVIFYHHGIDSRIRVSNRKGSFIEGEQLTFSPSGAVGRYVTDRWSPFGNSIYFVPLSGKPSEGDMVTGALSGATARAGDAIYDERGQIDEMLGYVRRTYPDMRIVTIAQGLDLYGVPKRTD